MKVILDGAYGFDNVGDEAMLHTAISLLRNAWPAVDIDVSSFNPEKIKKFHGVEGTNYLLPGTLLRNLKRLRFKNISRQIAFIRDSDVLLFAGGSILNDKKGLRDTIVIFYKVLMFRAFGKKVIFWGVAYDEVKSFIAKSMLKYIMRNASLVVFRDKLSADLVAQQLGDFKHVGSGIDILFGLLPTLVRSVSAKSSEDDVGPCRIGLSLRPYPPNIGFDLEALDEALCKQVTEYIHAITEKLGKSVVIVPLVFSDGDGARNDREIISRVERMLGTHAFAWSDLDVSACQGAGFGEMLNEYCENISSLDVVIGERFHSLVLAQILEVPYIAISYDKKIDELVKAVEMESYSLNLLKSLNDKSICAELLLMTERALLNRPELVRNIAKNNGLLELQSKENQSRIFGILS